MTQVVNIVVEDVEVQGPFQKKDGSGSFTKHVYKANGESYFKFGSTDSEPEYEVGQTLQLLVDAQEGFRGGKSNKIVKGNVVAEGVPTRVIQSPSKVGSITPEMAKAAVKAVSKSSTSYTKKPEFKSSYDPKGARTGMIVNKTVDLAIHNSSGGPVTAEDLSQSLQLLRDITKEAEQDN